MKRTIDSDNNLGIQGHAKMWKKILKETFVMIGLQLFTNLLLLVPLIITGTYFILIFFFALKLRRHDMYLDSKFFTTKAITQTQIEIPLKCLKSNENIRVMILVLLCIGRKLFWTH